MKLTGLIVAVRAVPGVNDFELNNVNLRTDATAFPPLVANMVAYNGWRIPEWNSGLQGAVGLL